MTLGYDRKARVRHAKAQGIEGAENVVLGLHMAY